jgi:hypothetical protein
MHGRQRPRRRVHVRLAALVPALVLATSCGGDGGEAGPLSGPVDTAGPGTAGPFGDPGGPTAGQTFAETTPGQQPSATTAAPPPPTAGGGESGVRTDPGGNQIIILPECGSIDVTAHLEQEAYAELRSRLSCIFANEAVAPADVVAAARAADAIAAVRIAEQQPGVVLDDRVQEVLEQPPPDLPPAFEEMLDEARPVAEDIAEQQEGG